MVGHLLLAYGTGIGLATLVVPSDPRGWLYASYLACTGLGALLGVQLCGRLYASKLNITSTRECEQGVHPSYALRAKISARQCGRQLRARTSCTRPNEQSSYFPGSEPGDESVLSLMRRSRSRARIICV